MGDGSGASGPAVDVTVWWADPQWPLDSFRGDLDSVEQSRAARFRVAADERRFVTGRALLRAAVGLATGQPGRQVRIDRTCSTCGEQHGRPTLPDQPDLSVSASHSGRRVVVAVTRAGPVGVDVEELTGIGTELVAQTCTPREQIELGRLPSERHDWGFLTYWCRKESLLKATGDGLRLDLRSIEVSPPADMARLVTWNDRPDLVATARMSALDPGEGYVAALTVIGQPELRVSEVSAAELLGLDR